MSNLKNNSCLNSFIKTEFNELLNIDKTDAYGHVMNYLHWHPHYEIQIIFSGVYITVNNGVCISSDKPAVFIHTPFSLHSTNADKKFIYRRTIISANRRLLSMIPSELLDMSVFTGVNMMYAFPSPADMTSYDNLLAEINKTNGDSSYDALFTALILKKTLDLIRCGSGDISRQSNSYILDALHYITDNLSDPPTVETLAKRYEIGKSKFNRDFKASTGSTYKKYMTDLRQTRARELLASGSSIINASLETGYSSEAHFIKAFREYWGVTPGEFKRD